MKIGKLPAIVKAVGLVTVISAVGKILGFVREAIIAAYFGASELADVFFVSNIIPTILYTAIGIAIYSGIVPIYVEEKEKDPVKADQVMSVLGTVFLVFASFIALVSFVFAEQITRLVAPGFNEEQLKLATNLTKIMLPSIVFLALTTISTGVLNAHKKFVAPSLTATAQNVVIIVSTILLANKYGVYGLAIGALLGTVAQFLIQYPQLSKYQISLNFQFKKEKERIKNTLILFYPIIISSLALQINGVTDRIISSGLSEGSVSALNYGNKLMLLPLSIIMAPLITVLYPSIVESALKGMDKFMELASKGAKIIIFISIPFIVVMIVNGQELIELAFQRGAFDNSATIKTVQVFLFYTFGLVFFALRDYLMNCFFALKKTKLAMYSSLVMVIINVILSIVLSRFLEASGIALATSLATLTQCIFLTIYLLKATDRHRSFTVLFLNKSLAKLLAAFGIVLACVYPVSLLLNDFMNIVQLVLVTIITFIIFLASSWLLKIPETTFIFQIFKKRGTNV